MSSSGLSPRQLALGTASAKLTARIQAGGPDAGSKVPAPGDRFVLRTTVDLPVEWVLLERHPELPAFLAVPADTHPLVGSRDVELPAGSDAGVLRLRCGFPTWLEVGQLTLRAGAIDDVTLAKARAKVRGARSGSSGPKAPGAVEESPEYRGWIREAVVPALAAVGAMTPEPQRARPRTWGRYRSALAWAVALSILLAGALAGWRIGREKPGRNGEGRRAERADAAREHRLVERLQTQEGQAAQLRQRIADLERTASTAAAAINVPVAVLYPAEPMRDKSEPTRIPARAAHLVAVLIRDDAEEYAAYRVVLTRRGSSAPLWQSDALERLDRGINLELPRELLSPGAYRFHLLGLRGSRAQPLGDYELIIAR
jgi:hypothetical protein